ncbi:MAG: class I SAM-dependent methyltransferase [Pyrinomonadaceae bacterium]
MTIKLYEVARKSIEPFLPPLYKQVRVKLLREIRKFSASPSILDVGGRKSPYTIGVPGRITIIDLPRNTEVQSALNLGLNESIVNRIKSRRSNIDRLIIGDMTKSGIPGESFDLAVSVEVLEHVQDDEKFVSEVCRVLKPGGRFIMTTPNGDFVENRNPDHKRHYKKQQLSGLLEKYFTNVEVEYAIAGGRYRKIGLKAWSLNRPLQTVSSAFGNIVNSYQSSRKDIKDRAIGTHHLVAVAEKH